MFGGFCGSLTQCQFVINLLIEIQGSKNKVITKWYKEMSLTFQYCGMLHFIFSRSLHFFTQTLFRPHVHLGRPGQRPRIFYRIDEFLQLRKWGRRAWQLRTLYLVTLQSAARMQVESRRRIRRSWKSQKCILHLILLWISKSLNSTKKTQPRKLEKKLPTDVCLITCTAGQLDTGGSLSVSWFWFQVQNARNRRS